MGKHLFFPPLLIPFTSFACLIALARIHSAVLNGNSVVVSDILVSFTIKCIVHFLFWFLYIPFVKLMISSISTWLRFYLMIKSWIFIKWFYYLTSVKVILIVFLLFYKYSELYWMIFLMLICPLVPRKSLHGDYALFYYILLI